jgi:RNA polymerase sigma-70 factor (ECF subfamily)
MIERLSIEVERSPSGEEQRDAALIERLCGDDAAALDELLQLHWSALVGYAERILESVDAAEDIAQQTFLRLWERRASWTPGGSLRAYLYRIARNLALNARRHRSVRAKWSQCFRRQYAPHPATPEQVMAGNELEVAIEKAIAALPERRREVFELVRFHSLSYREVGEIMGISVQTVANQMSAALSDLRAALASFLEEPAPVPLPLRPRTAPPPAASPAIPPRAGERETAR